MKVLVIPDVHLKPEIFDQAMQIMENPDYKMAVCVGDIADDWGCERNVELYEETFRKAVEFAEKYPETLWCYGNHDLSYKWDVFDHPGFSRAAHDIVCEYLEKLNATGNLAIMHRIDNAVFSHAGLTREFVDSYLSEYSDDIDSMIEAVNDMGYDVLWDDNPVDVTQEANFIWSIANKLRGSYMPDKYGDVIIPMTIMIPGITSRFSNRSGTKCLPVFLKVSNTAPAIGSTRIYSAKYPNAIATISII